MDDQVTNTLHDKQLYAALGSTPAEEATTPSAKLQPEDKEDYADF